MQDDTAAEAMSRGNTFPSSPLELGNRNLPTLHRVATGTDLWGSPPALEVMYRDNLTRSPFRPPTLQIPQIHTRAERSPNLAGTWGSQPFDFRSGRDCDESGTSEYSQFLPLSKAINQGDLEAVKNFLNLRPDAVDAWINLYNTPLLSACACGQLEIVKELLQRMDQEQTVPWRDGGDVPYHTPLTVVAITGNMEIAKALVAKNPVLIEIAGKDNLLPVVHAVASAQKKMARYLYHKTPVHLLLSSRGYHGILLLFNAIFYGMLGIEVRLPETSSTDQDQRIDQIYELKETHLKAHKLLQRISEVVSDMGETTRAENMIHKALFSAVRLGNKDFVVEMIKSNPEFLWSRHPKSHGTLFLMAVEYRQEKIFNLFYGLDERRDMLVDDMDNNGNGILHIAGRLSPPDRLSQVAGATLQLQRELQWFEEVESIVPQIAKERRNKDGRKPREIFADEHEALRKEAEKWIKNTATSCSVVAALIVTITFAAIFTIPGGTDNNSGLPLRLKDKHFMTFIISDMVSCFTSCASVLIFLGILNARYSFQDFLVSLPTRIIAGLCILFVSLAAMLVAFSTALFLMLNQISWLVPPVTVLACLPAVLFVRLQYPLLQEMIISTYWQGVFNRDTTRWLGG